jgi:hypothetical protein
LEKGIELERYCTKHQHKDRFECDPNTLKKNLYCKERSDNCNETTDGGVFFRHIGCVYKNPFWDSAKQEVSVPGDETKTAVQFRLDFDTGQDMGVNVQHWLLGVLRNVPRDTREMWFPAMLLRATAEKRFATRIGSLVELAGARESGKTILAVQMMTRHGYLFTHNSKNEVLINNFVYSPVESTGDPKVIPSFRRYIETLHLVSLLQRNNKEIFLPIGTRREQGHLKAAFIKPSKNWHVSTEDDDDDEMTIQQKSVKWLKKTAVNFLEELKIAGASILGSESRPFWYTIILYDPAGENSEEEDLRRDNVDKVAIVINAEDIFDLKRYSTEEGVSLRVANRLIAQGVDRKQKLFLVVTQMDKIKNYVGADDWKRVETVADDVNLKKSLSREAKELLKKWLVQIPTENKTELKEKLKFVDKVFFVWTEDLPDSYIPKKQDKLPKSKGLARFVCACLEIKLSQITQS